MKLNGLKIFAVQAALDCARDWFLPLEDICSPDEALQQPYKVAAVPIMFNEPTDFLYETRWHAVDLSGFDLVLLSDIEYRPWWEIEAWITKNRIRNWILARGSIDWKHPEPQDRIVYRPWWIYHRDLKANNYQHTDREFKPYIFDCLLGSRRPNRDFVMFSMEKYGLLDHNIVTYRNIFPGAVVDPVNWPVQEMFTNQSMTYPYVSPNLDPSWEVRENLDNSISEVVPWRIYEHTWFTIVCESVYSDAVFFMAEKISKPMMAGRAFVVFGPRGFLAQLRQLGYQTFHPVIDESYDCEPDAFVRWRMAFEQVRRLHEQEPLEIVNRLKPQTEHNRQWINSVGVRMRDDMHRILRQYIPPQWILD